MSDKSSETEADADADASKEGDQPAGALASKDGASSLEPNRRDGRLLAGKELKEHSTARLDQPPVNATKPKNRGGRPVAEKVPLTITWTKKMEFMGRSIDLEGRPAAKAIFYGTVLAEMEDGLLRCEDHMITYADKIVPLKQLGSLSEKKPRGSARPAEEDAEPEPKPDLAVIECFGKAVAITRKVHPDRPLELQRQMVHGEYLNYDRRSGEFYVPGEGLVYLYDRPKKSRDQEGPDAKGNGGLARVSQPRRAGRSLRPQAGRQTQHRAPSAPPRRQAVLLPEQMVWVMRRLRP